LLPREHEGFDPVAAFHLSNGARLERINLFADPSPRMMPASYGVMVNYLYEPDEVIDNHERFVGSGEVTLSRRLTRLHERLAAIWRANDAPMERAER
jgi:malonyl-CoA decarboxylase